MFNREGEHYLKDYPIVLNLIDLFYKMFCPILFAVVNIAHIVKEWQNNTRTLPLIIDSLGRRLWRFQAVGQRFESSTDHQKKTHPYGWVFF